MQANKAVIALLLAMALTGCNVAEPDPGAKAYGERMAELEYLESQAAVYSACTWLVNVCPKSVTAKGNEVVQAGYAGGGGASPWFWLMVLGKFLVLGASLGAAARLLTRWGMDRVVTPSAKAAEAARNEVQTAKQQAADLLAQVRKQTENMTQEARDKQQQLHELHAQAKGLQGRVQQLQADIETLKGEQTQAKEEAERLALLAQAARNFD